MASILDTPTSAAATPHSFTVSAGTNRALIVGVTQEGTTLGAPTVTYGGQSMVNVVDLEINPGTTSQRATIFFLNNAGIVAASGTSIVVSNAVTTMSIHAASYENCVQTTPTNTDTDSSTAATPNPLAACDIVTGAANAVVVAVAGMGNDGTAAWAAPLTERTEQSMATTATGSLADDEVATATTVACECTWTTQNRAVICALEIVHLAAEGITSIDPTTFDMDNADIDINGVNFLATQGTGTVYISDADTLAGSVNEVEIANGINTWSDTVVNLDLTGLNQTEIDNLNTLGPGTRYIILVNNDSDEYGSTAITLHRAEAFVMSLGAGTPGATTARLTAPATKTTGDFDAGRFEEAANPATAVNITADNYTEMVWSIEAKPLSREVSYDFRVTKSGVVLDTYSVTPQLTISVGYTMTAESGSYSLTGTSVDLLRNYLVTATSGSHNLTGTDVDLKRGYYLEAESDSYGLTGQDVDFPIAYRLEAESGSYAKTGTAVELDRGYYLEAESGSYEYAGAGDYITKDTQGQATNNFVYAASTVDRAYIAGSFTAGSDHRISKITLNLDDIWLTASDIVYTVEIRNHDGTDPTTVLTNGTSSITGVTGAEKPYDIYFDPGCDVVKDSRYAVVLHRSGTYDPINNIGFFFFSSGQEVLQRDADGLGTWTMQESSCEVAIITYSGAAEVQLRYNRYIEVESEAYTKTGQDVDFPRTYRLDAESGSYAQTGTDVDPLYGRLFSAESGRYFIVPGYTLGSDILVDPGFEDYTGDQDNDNGWFNEWSAVGTADNIVDPTATVHGGSNAVKFIKANPDYPQYNCEIYADASPDNIENEYLELKYWTRGDGGHGQISAKISGGGLEKLRSGVTGTTYTEVTVYLQSVTDYPYIEFHNEEMFSTAYVDDASIKVLTHTTALRWNRLVDADSGSYAKTGTDVDLYSKRYLEVESGSYAQTGQDVELDHVVGYSLDAESGSYGLTGTAVDLLYDRTLDIDSGSYDLVGATYGSDLASDGDCSAGTLSMDAGWTHDAINDEYDATSTTENLIDTPILEVGKFYKIKSVWGNITGGTVQMTSGIGGVGINVSEDGTYYDYIETTTPALVYNAFTSFTGSLQSYEVREQFSYTNLRYNRLLGIDSGEYTYKFGPDLLNGLGDCSTDFFDTVQTGWSHNGSTEKYDCDGSQVSSSDLVKHSVIGIGEYCRITLTVSNYSAGNVRVQSPFETSPINITANGTYTFYGTSGVDRITFRANLSFIGSIDDITIQEVSEETYLYYNRLIEAESGVYTQVGQAVTLVKTGAYELLAEAGAYAKTGTDVGLRHNYTLECESGSYAQTGIDATLTYTPISAYFIDAESGSFSLTGTDTDLLRGYPFIAENGSYVSSGTVVDLLRGLLLDIEAGSYAATGQAVELLRNYFVTATSGSLALTGTDIDFIRGLRIGIDSGHYSQVGRNVALLYSEDLPPTISKRLLLLGVAK